MDAQKKIRDALKSEVLKRNGEDVLALLENDIDRFSKFASGLVKKSIFPEKGESVAITLSLPKTAALAFDRVYQFPGIADSPPDQISFRVGGHADTAFVTNLLIEKLRQEVPDLLIDENPVRLRGFYGSCLRQFEIEPVFLFEDEARRLEQFEKGPNKILHSSISNLDIVVEESLEWQQIIDFRSDENARRKYRQMIRWIDSEIAGISSASAIEDLIAQKLDDYDWVIKKHGFKTRVGVASSLLDPKFFASIAGTVVGGVAAGIPLWGALAGSALTVGRAAVALGVSRIDRYDEIRKTSPEIAYVADVKSEFI